MKLSWVKIFFTVLLLLGLPVFIWAVLTQRLELRKRAATAEPVEICWNRVITFNDTYNWPNSCKGSPRTDLVCSQIIIPLTSEEITGYKNWITMGSPYIPGCGPAPSTTPITVPECALCSTNVNCAPGLICQNAPTPTPDCPNGPTGPCNVIISPRQICVKPDGTSSCSSTTPTPTPTPQPTCTDTDGGANFYTYGILKYTNNPNGVLQEYDSCDGTALIEGVCNSQLDHTQNRIRFNCPYGCSNGVCLNSPILSPTPTPTPMPTTMKFLIRLAGVNGTEAQGATINVKLKLKNGTILPLDRPLVLTPIGNGVYSATATLTNPLPAGTSLRVLVKGEKHSQVEFCRQSGQTDPCNDTEYITPSGYSFDFSNRPLPPGDLNQDGRVNSEDLALITDIFKKPSSQQTPQDLKTADVNYSGKIDSLDLSLVFQTLETRYDEQ